ncbi:MAG: aldo/keto reductase [Thermoanaerobaculia bacterium]|nr:aldo/keto reductase [Thermoanaerobaculia bacterium]
MSGERPERVELAPGYSVSRVINGGWQLAAGHGAARGSREERVRGLLRLAERGFTTFDVADIYTGVEELLGEVVRRWRRDGGGPPLRIHTKCVPDRAALSRLTRADVARTVERSLARLGVERLDLVQLHWWEYEVPGYVEAALWLEALRREGKIRLLGVTNFDRSRLAEMLDAGAEIATIQLQYSLLDRRPEGGMSRLCAQRGVSMLAYGTLAGGYLGERWLGAPAPPAGSQENRSLTKYRLIVEEAGGWARLQELLAATSEIGRRHGVSAANVATRWVLERSGVAAAILGATSARHVEENLRLFSFRLDEEDRALLTPLLAAAPGPRGDVYGLERHPGSPHRQILRTDLQGA